MRALALTTAATLLFCGCEGAADGPAEEEPAGTPAPREETTMAFELTSSAFDADETIPTRHTCDGDDVSPPLAWSDPPDGTEAFALVASDPDAPGGTFVHWVLYDLPGHATGLPDDVGGAQRLENLGEAKQGRNDFGDVGYGGPCPPGGETHRYVFRLHALDATLGLDPGVALEEVERVMEGRVLGAAELTGRYARE